LQADVLPADRVSDLTTYQAIILGSAVYTGQWQKPQLFSRPANCIAADKEQSGRQI